MSIFLLLFWICCVTSVTLLGSWYVRRYDRVDLLVALYVTFILVAQILAAKVSVFDLGFVSFIGPSGVILFSITYLLTDIVNERFGRKETYRMIRIAFVSQVAMVCFLWLGTQLQPAPFWTLQGPWEQIFGAVPRITFASWVAFLVTEHLDAYVYAWFKQRTRGRYLWSRSVFSSLPALLMDSLIFIPIAFGGLMPLWPLIVGQTVLKWMVGVVSVPFLYLNRAVMGATNGKQAEPSATSRMY